MSWCKFEVTIDFAKDIHVSTSSKTVSEIPPVVVTAINLKTIINEKQNVNEIVSASVICCHRAKVCHNAVSHYISLLGFSDFHNPHHKIQSIIAE